MREPADRSDIKKVSWKDCEAGLIINQQLNIEEIL
jgi:hypothetical protein